MNDKHQMVNALRAEFTRWEDLLSSLREEQITTRQLPANLSIKDVLGHLRAWQQISIARLTAALHGQAPEFVEWPAGLEPDGEENLESINGWIHATYRDQPWSSVHQAWRTGFLRFLELGEAASEKDLLQEEYTWLDGHPLVFVLQGSYEHHQEHLDELLAWLRAHDNG